MDLRTVTFDVPPQEILSRDSVTVTVDAVIYYRVSNPTMVSIFIWHAGCRDLFFIRVMMMALV